MSNTAMHQSINGERLNISQENCNNHFVKNHAVSNSGSSKSNGSDCKPKIRIVKSSETMTSSMPNGRGMGRHAQVNTSYLTPGLSSGLSKSDQMLNRLLRDQLELAYIDHEKNLRTAQSYAAFQQLKNSQPRLEVTPTHSRSASPRRSHQRMNGRSHSPLTPKHSGDGSGWSSGSENSFRSNRSAPSNYMPGTPVRLQHHQQTNQFKPVVPPRGYQTAPCSPVHRQQGASTPLTFHRQEQLLKHAHVNVIWSYIYDAVNTGQLENLEESNPKVWWRKLFLILKYKHGKAKASSIAGQLMGNPLVLEAIQNKLADMVGDQSGYIQTLPPSVQRRVKALKKLQFESTKIEAEFYQAVHELECKFAAKYSPIYSKRREIVNGKYEPNEEECDWPSEDEDDEEGAEKPPKEEVPEPETPTKGIASFWSTTLKNVELLANMIQEQDEVVLDHLTDITVKVSEKPMGFTLEFHFSENDYFTNQTLTKWYEMRSCPDENDPFGFEGPEIVACEGCQINWKDGKNITIRSMVKKQKNAKTGKERTITKTVPADSFFNFFSPPVLPTGDEATEDDIDEDTEALLQADYEIGHFIRERIVPHAVLYFTGEAIVDDDDGEDDDDVDLDDDYEDEEDPDYDPSKDPKAAVANKECKQQ